MRQITLLLALLLSSTAAFAQPDCGDNGGVFGRQFVAQYDRPEVPVVPVYFETQPELQAACDRLAMHYGGIPNFRRTTHGCADMYLRTDGRHGYIFLLKGGREDTEKHERCHIRYGAWHR